jgi:chromosomal replication initiation ATPase DnaA|tara:strand:- start:1175 stop:1651 length:477 start_codon:yes stop_codon:yes gene_type:complete
MNKYLEEVKNEKLKQERKSVFKNHLMAFKKEAIVDAKKILSTIYKIDFYFLENNVSRKREIIDARRIFIYYMNKELKIPYTHLKKYVKGLHHATGIYHCKAVTHLLITDRSFKEKYEDFLSKICASNNYKLLDTMIEKKLGQLKNIEKEIITLKKEKK